MLSARDPPSRRRTDLLHGLFRLHEGEGVGGPGLATWMTLHGARCVPAVIVAHLQAFAAKSLHTAAWMRATLTV